MNIHELKQQTAARESAIVNRNFSSDELISIADAATEAGMTMTRLSELLRTRRFPAAVTKKAVAPGRIKNFWRAGDIYEWLAKTAADSKAEIERMRLSPKFCKDCKYFDNKAYKDPAKCTAPATQIMNLVHGYMSPFCHMERGINGIACGREGLLFVQAGPDGLAGLADSSGNLIQAGSDALTEHGR